MANTIIAGNATNNGLAFSSDNTGILNILTGSGAGTNALTIDASQNVVATANLTVTGTVTATGGVSGGIRSGTAVTASGTSVDFTSLPTGLKRITVMLNGVSTNGTSTIRFQLGDSGGIETTGYAGVCTQIGSTVSSITSTSGFDSTADTSASQTRNGSLVFALLGSNIWTVFGGYNIATGGAFQYLFTGSKTLSDTLDRIRITTVNGTDTFDAGSINILFE